MLVYSEVTSSDIRECVGGIVVLDIYCANSKEFLTWSGPFPVMCVRMLARCLERL